MVIISCLLGGDFLFISWSCDLLSSHMTVLVVPRSSFSSSSLRTYIQESMLGTTTSRGANPLNKYWGPSLEAMLSMSLAHDVFLMPGKKHAVWKVLQWNLRNCPL